MLQVFEAYRSGELRLNLNNTTDPYSVAGVEALTIPERIKFFFKESSLNIDQLIGKISFNIHQVDVDKLRKNTQTINFLKNTATPLTVPAYFNPTVCDWKTYQDKVLQSVLLAIHLNKEADDFYSWLKEIVKTGKVGRLYQFSVSDFEQLVGECDEFISSLKNSDSKRKPMGELYDNFGLMAEQMGRFNLNVKPLKARDVEILDKTFNNIYDIGNLLYRKIDVKDITLSKEDVDLIKDRIQMVVKALNITGAMVGLLNELTAVYRSQIEEISRVK